MAPAPKAELDEYVQLLLRELNLPRQQQPEAAPLETIFFGGGTPSLLSAEQVGELLAQLKSKFIVPADCEISLEANPGTLTAEKLAAYRSVGVNRLSLGVQSLCDEQLRSLGRIHSKTEVRQAVSMARAAGFSNLSLDLIFALPNQTLEQLKEDVLQVLELEPEHLSIYGLSFEPGTPLHDLLQAGELVEADEQFYADSYLLIDQLLTAGGFEHYEISNFARPGYRCRHNQNYWQRRSCYTLGCGAHSFSAAGWGERCQVPADLGRYRRLLLAGKEVAERLETFSRQAAMAETIYLALRTRDGLCREQFREAFGDYPENEFSDAFGRCQPPLQRRGDRWCFSPQDWLLYDHLISHFL
jgi:oxygen-independent coproporphyrinogen-3 oxidase